MGFEREIRGVLCKKMFADIFPINFSNEKQVALKVNTKEEVGQFYSDLDNVLSESKNGNVIIWDSI